jgi:hypothetical protein
VHFLAVCCLKSTGGSPFHATETARRQGIQLFPQRCPAAARMPATPARRREKSVTINKAGTGRQAMNDFEEGVPILTLTENSLCLLAKN